MKIILTGSLGHISRPLTQQLLKAGHEVTVISHNSDRAPEITALGATPAIGSIADEAFLTQTFAGADVVYLMITAAASGMDIFAAGKQQAQTYVNAVKANKVKQVVNLSSIGAEGGPEVGALHIYNIIEGVLTAGLPGVNLTFVRPTGMYYNLFSHLTTIKQSQTIYTNAAIDKPQSWVAPADIVPVVFKALTAPEAGVTSQYVASDELSYQQVAIILGNALGLEVKVVQIDDDTALKGMLAAGAPASFATEYIKMVAFERDHDFYADYRQHQPVLGPTKLTDFAANELVPAYQKLS
ncbi:SDR family oxidoreductase [Lactiplantibacillus mudanjiangensis]|uniref:NAD(P)-binding domain-containing protein n=1 Tax=Lactiplantibacillus mudanjiangensis TaxID=1296538 RepID=A0A660E630_9LACO|nr:NAD(P)H-binding protein [Lactiplantibacillus mudanjiangensis]VDG25437.1 hypothetical protein [Lactobacillus zymae] [Lactiplantibacillus mudanjiangensis]VDG28535.1 hypothetical protein [Lactobacillus zymae] [Lactiplantibacillus mudanjiangensis]